MPPRLSPLTQQLVENLFEPSDQAEATRRLVDECGNNLPFCGDKNEYQLERIRFAVLRISLGYPDDLQEAIHLAQRDWRDVLVWAGFGESLTAHREWAERTVKGNAASMVIVVIGMTGAGKTTIGTLLARTLGWMYYETDGFLSIENFNKVIRGEPLAEDIVEAWIAKTRLLIGKYLAKRQNAVIACSMLKESYRQPLRVSGQVHFIYLLGRYEQIEERQKKRKPGLPHLERLAYEHENFEEPREALAVDISRPPEEIVGSIRRDLEI